MLLAITIAAGLYHLGQDLTMSHVNSQLWPYSADLDAVE